MFNVNSNGGSRSSDWTFGDNNMKRRKVLHVVLLKADMELRREADIQQLLVVKEEVPTEQHEWSSSLDQEDPEPPHIKEEQEDPEPPHIKEDQGDPEPPHIKEEQEDPEPPHIKEDQEYPEPPHIKEEQEDPEPSHIKEDPEPPYIKEDQGDPEPPHIKEDQEDPEPPHIKEEQEDPEPPHIKEEQEDPEPLHIKEEQEELWTSQEGEQLQGLEEADVKFSITPVRSEDDEEEAQSSQLHQRQTEQMETEADGEDCGGPEPVRDSDPDLEPDADVKTEPSSEPDDSVDVEFWKETRKHQSGYTYQRNKKVSVNDGFNSSKKPFSCSDDEAETEPKTDDGVEGDRPQSGPKHLNSEEVSVRDPGCNTDMKPFSSSECHEISEDSLTLLTHKNPPMGEKPFSCSVCNTDCSDSKSLVQHMRSHTRRTRFRCQTCGEEFSWRRYLTKHLEVHKTYRCIVCDQRFIWLCQLKYHKCVGRRSAKLHQTENREAEPPASSSTEQMETEADGEDCGVPEPVRDSDPDLEPDADVKFSITPVKSEDDEEEAQSSQLHQRQTEQMETEADGEDCGGPEPVRDSDPDLEPDADVKTEPSSEPDDSVDVEFWKETRKHQSGYTYQRNKKVSVNDGFNSSKKPFSCSDDEAETEPKTDDGVEGDRPQSGPKHLNSEEVSVRDPGCNTDMKPFSSSECHEISEDSLTLLTHKNPPMGEKPFSCSVCTTDCSDSKSLVQHMRSHTRRTRFRCQTCGEEFSWRRYLTKHLEVHKTYRCIVCDQRFIWLCQLKYHKCVCRRSAKLHQTENREAEPPASSSTEQMETEADGEDCGVPEPVRDSDPDLEPDADVKFSITPVKSEDDEEEAQSSQLHQRQTEQMETEADGEDCGGPEPVRDSDPDLEPDADVKTEPSSEPDDSVDVEFWKETRKHQSGYTYQRNKKGSVNDGFNSSKKPFGCSDDEAETEPKTDDGVEGDRPQSGPKHLNSEEVSVRDPGCNTDMKPFSSSECHERSEDSLTLLTHKNPPMGEKPFGCSVCNTNCSDSKSLVQHMRSHTRRTRFRCQTCGQEFSWRRHLTKHMEVHKIYRCIVCDQRFIWLCQLKCHKCVGRRSAKRHQTENREAEPPASSSTEQMETEADGEDCGVPEPDRDSDPDRHPQPDPVDKTGDSSEPETDDSDDWKEI